MEGQTEFQFHEKQTCPHGTPIGGGERCEQCEAEDRDERNPYASPVEDDGRASQEQFRAALRSANPELAERVASAEAGRVANRPVRDGSGEQITDRRYKKSPRERRRR